MAAVDVVSDGLDADGTDHPEDVAVAIDGGGDHRGDEGPSLPISSIGGDSHPSSSSVAAVNALRDTVRNKVPPAPIRRWPMSERPSGALRVGVWSAGGKASSLDESSTAEVRKFQAFVASTLPIVWDVDILFVAGIEPSTIDEFTQETTLHPWLRNWKCTSATTHGKAKEPIGVACFYNPSRCVFSGPLFSPSGFSEDHFDHVPLTTLVKPLPAGPQTWLTYVCLDDEPPSAQKELDHIAALLPGEGASRAIVLGSFALPSAYACVGGPFSLASIERVPGWNALFTDGSVGGPGLGNILQRGFSHALGQGLGDSGDFFLRASLHQYHKYLSGDGEKDAAATSPTKMAEPVEDDGDAGATTDDKHDGGEEEEGEKDGKEGKGKELGSQEACADGEEEEEEEEKEPQDGGDKGKEPKRAEERVVDEDPSWLGGVGSEVLWAHLPFGPMQPSFIRSAPPEEGHEPSAAQVADLLERGDAFRLIQIAQGLERNRLPWLEGMFDMWSVSCPASAGPMLSLVRDAIRHSVGQPRGAGPLDVGAVRKRSHTSSRSIKNSGRGEHKRGRHRRKEGRHHHHHRRNKDDSGTKREPLSPRKLFTLRGKKKHSSPGDGEEAPQEDRLESPDQGAVAKDHQDDDAKHAEGGDGELGASEKEEGEGGDEGGEEGKESPEDAKDTPKTKKKKAAEEKKKAAEEKKKKAAEEKERRKEEKRKAAEEKKRKAAEEKERKRKEAEAKKAAKKGKKGEKVEEGGEKDDGVADNEEEEKKVEEAKKTSKKGKKDKKVEEEEEGDKDDGAAGKEEGEKKEAEAKETAKKGKKDKVVEEEGDKDDDAAGKEEEEGQEEGRKKDEDENPIISSPRKE